MVWGGVKVGCTVWKFKFGFLVLRFGERLGYLQTTVLLRQGSFPQAFYRRPVVCVCPVPLPPH